jgi:hypothetical protein
MGTVRYPAPVKLFCALLVAPTFSVSEVEATLEQIWGNIVLRSTPMPFTQTTYYRREMGAELTRFYAAFEPLIQSSELAAAKHTAHHLEAIWCTPHRQRQVNIDPGYLDLAKVVLATTKDYVHRLYIGAGIFAEVTLRYQQKSFRPWEWTYPDYRLPETLDFFNRLRTLYHLQMRQPETAPHLS